jgi:hypothetical protein
MRKLVLDLDSITVESYDATPRSLDSAQGTIEAHAAEAVPYSYNKTGCAPYTQDMAYPECVCDLSRTCPTYDFNCPVEEEAHVEAA